MGSRDKLLEKVDGIPLLRLIAERALKVSDDVHVLLRPGFNARRKALEGLEIRTFVAPEALEGMNGSLRAATAHMAKHDAYLLMLGDLPEITAENMQTVLDARAGQPDNVIWRGATEDGTPGHPILLSRPVYGALLQISGDGGGRTALKPFKDQTCLVPLPGTRARCDLDTPEDWAAWRAARNRRVP